MRGACVLSCLITAHPVCHLFRLGAVGRLQPELISEASDRDIKVCSVITSTRSITESVLLLKMASLIPLIPDFLGEFPRRRGDVADAATAISHTTQLVVLMHSVLVSLTFVHL